MTAEEAKNIIVLLKQGKVFKDNVSVQGFIEIYFNDDEDEFIYYSEIVSDDIYNPDIEQKSYSENQFKKLLEKKYDYDYFFSNLVE